MASGTKPMTYRALQACAVAYRRVRGRVEFCLITTSQGRWNFPKGIVDPGETHDQAALKEAFEEAGLHGRIVGEPLGTYPLAKFGRTFQVTALLMQVDQCDENWQEEHLRQRRWVTADEARQLLTQQHLHDLLDESLRRLES
jgi:8-oxo-dGTP pyrophosphatase MutT (NUDIX family)